MDLLKGKLADIFKVVAILFALALLMVAASSCEPIQKTIDSSIERKEDSLLLLKSSIEDQNAELLLIQIGQLEGKMIGFLNEAQCPPEYVMRNYEEAVAQYNEYAKDRRKREYEIERPYKGLLIACREVNKR